MLKLFVHTDIATFCGHASDCIVSKIFWVYLNLLYSHYPQFVGIDILYSCGQWIRTSVHHIVGRTSVQAAGASPTFVGILLHLLFCLLFWNIREQNSATVGASKHSVFW